MSGNSGDDADSLNSWQGAEDVFPEAAWEYETARQLKRGIRNADTEMLTAQVLGIEPSGPSQDAGSVNGGVHDNDDAAEDDDDDDNVDEDGHFDMYSYQEERRPVREERKNDIEKRYNDNDSLCSLSSHNSQVTLVELSSVGMNIGEDELAALTDVDGNDEFLGCSSHGGGDPGKMDASNTVLGKRKRTAVDYRKLNDAIFGDVSDRELERLTVEMFLLWLPPSPRKEGSWTTITATTMMMLIRETTTTWMTARVKAGPTSNNDNKEERSSGSN